MGQCWPKAPAPAPTPLFEYLPVGLFAAVMGLSGLSAAWRLAGDRYGAPAWVSSSVAAAAVLSLALLCVAYLAKALTALDAVRAEFRHPIVGNLFGTIPISLLLLTLMLPADALWLARTLWGVGTVGILAFAWLIVRRWMSVRQRHDHATPAWIVPVVGVLDVPLAFPQLALPEMHGLMVACLSIGLFFAVPLFTVILSRLIFEEPMAGSSQATLLILLAPFSVGFSAYVSVIGQVDLFAEGLYGLMIFMLAVLISKLRDLSRCCPFRVAWWAVSFPLAASASASVRFAQAAPGIVSDAIAVTTLGLASVVIGGLLARTVVGVVRGELRTLSS